MNVFLTGVAGFIGSNLAQALLEQGHSVAGLDDFSVGTRLNLETCLRNPLFRLVQGDVRDASVVEPLVAEADTVVHLAAGKIPRYEHALDTLSVNMKGTRTVVAAASRHGRHLVFASTSDVYGCNPDVPFHEGSAFVIGPGNVRRWSYALSKVYGEQIIRTHARDTALRYTILRLFGGYGPGQSLTWRGGPQAVFIGAALRGEPLQIHGDGEQTRSFTYVSDHVDAFLRAILTPPPEHNVFNIGSTREITIRDLATLVWAVARGGEPRLEFIPYRTFGNYQDVRRRVPDVTRASEYLRFTAKMPLETGLQKTTEWQRNRLEQEALCR